MPLVHTATFTPSAACTVVVTCEFQAEWSSGDTGAFLKVQPLVEQSAVVQLGPLRSIGRTLARGSCTYAFPVNAGAAVTYGLNCDLTGPISSTFTDVYIKAEQIKA